MPSPLKLLQTNTFTEGMSSDIAAELMKTTMYRYMLNCSVLSTAEGDMGIVRNVKGNVEVFFSLPEGRNIFIGKALDEETNNLYYALWNSEGYHGWYRYNVVDKAIIRVIQIRTDTNDEDIWKWPEGKLILTAEVVDNNLLYWTMEGETPRKIDISKCLDKSSTGYGLDIKESFTRAYKRTATYPPGVSYFTDTTKKFNRLYGKQFKFAQRFKYDNGEWSNWSQFSAVPKPDEELFTGVKSIPSKNNGIKITMETGTEIVKSIELAMMTTNPEGSSVEESFQPWVSVIVIDKEEEGIASNSVYTYNFYNETSVSSLDQNKVNRHYSYLPKDPKLLAFTKNALVYSYFHEGFPTVKIDVEYSVRYEDIFIEDAVENEFNDPSITFEELNVYWDHDRRRTEGIIRIGGDVKAGNTFTVYFTSARNGHPNINQTLSTTATLADNSITIANKLSSQLRAIQGDSDYYKNSYVGEVEPSGVGGAQFQFAHRTAHNYNYWQITTTVNPVQTNTLKDTGQSVQNIKLGSSKKYGIVYYDSDGRESAVYSANGMTVYIKTINELGGIKKPIITFNINHRPPLWATSWQIVRTDDLVYGSYIQMLIQQAVVFTTSTGDEYLDLVVGSLFAYQRIHPNTTLRYEFSKGDRIRLISEYDGADWSIPADVIDFEVLEYREVTEEVINENVTVDGSDTVSVTNADEDNIGNFIRIDGNEREILSVSTGQYHLTLPIATGDPDHTTKTYPSYEIVNRRGVIRIKNDPDYPFNVDPDANQFVTVEIYKPSIGSSSANENIFYDFGQKFPIINPGQDNAYHGGNVQNQTSSQPAIIEISNGTAYVRNRELPTNMDVENAQILVGVIEDGSYSDFYVSNMTDNGRSYGLDIGTGEVLFGSRFRWSNNYIEDTRINGLNDFDNLDRVDYNDKYGDVENILFEEGRLYVFKHLKDAWASVFGRVISEQSGQTLLAQSTNMLPDMLQYLLWDGGVGDNPESVVKNGNNIYHFSPNSGTVIRIGGDGADPISIIYSLDSDIRLAITSANKAKAKIFGGFDRKNGVYLGSIEGHDNILYDSGFSESGWITTDDALPTAGVTYEIVTAPEHGTATVVGDVVRYTPDTNYSGEDGFEYRAIINGVPQPAKHVCMNVIYVEGPREWRAIDEYCVTNAGVRNGYKGWSTLEEYLVFYGTATGRTKPNSPSDPDYVAPIYDPATCSPESEILLFTTTSNASSWPVTINTGGTSITVEARQGATVISSVTNGTALKTLNLSSATGSKQIYVRGGGGFAEDIGSITGNGLAIDFVNTGSLPELTSIDLGDNNITSVDLSGNTNLVSVDLSDNNIGSISVSANTALQTLVLASNSLSTINVSSNTDLVHLDLRNNNLSSINTLNLSSLEILQVSSNNITSLNLVNNTDLTILEAQDNGLTTINVSMLPNLDRLLLAINSLSTLDISSNPLITWLTVDQNNISSIDISNLSILSTFDCTRNTSLTTLDISSNNNLTDLRCGECPFTLDTGDPSIVDAIIIKMNSNITSGGVLHYDALPPEGIQPTVASRPAYDSLVTKGTEIQGKPPLTS